MLSTFSPHLSPFSLHLQRHGHGKYTSKREGVYEGLWYNDLRHGKGRQQYPNKDAYDGSWELNLVSSVMILHQCSNGRGGGGGGG